MCHVGVFVDKKTSIRSLVSHLRPIFPVGRGQLQNFNRVRLDVDVEVAEVHDGVDPGLDEDDSSNQFMEVDVLIQRKNGSQSQISQHGDGVPENKNQDQYRVEQKCSSAGPTICLIQ